MDKVWRERSRDLPVRPLCDSLCPRCLSGSLHGGVESEKPTHAIISLGAPLRRSKHAKKPAEGGASSGLGCQWRLLLCSRRFTRRLVDVDFNLACQRDLPVDCGRKRESQHSQSQQMWAWEEGAASGESNRRHGMRASVVGVTAASGESDSRPGMRAVPCAVRVHGKMAYASTQSHPATWDWSCIRCPPRRPTSQQRHIS